MPLRLTAEGADRYDGLASLNWPSPDGKEQAPIHVGSNVRVLARGSFTTDKDGVTLAVNGWSPTDVMRGSLNHAWEIWVKPEIERFRNEGIPLPAEIRSVLVQHEEDRMRLHINADGGVGHMVLRPGITLKNGDDVTADMILDVADVTPPTHEGKATAYYFVRFRNKQISVVFDMRPGEEGGPTEWSDEDKAWYGSALAEQMLAGIYGHVVLLQQKLVKCDIPFCLGLPANKMVGIADAADGGRDPAQDFLTANVAADDWGPLVDTWATSDNWSPRGHLFREALEAYRSEYYAAAVTLLLPQIEGVIMEHLVAQGKGLRENGWVKKWALPDGEASVVGDLESELRARDFGYVRQTVAYTLLNFLRSSSLYSKFNWRDGGKPAGRHPILHGYEKEFGTKDNADRLLMVLDSLFWLVGMRPIESDNDEEE